MKYIAKEPKNEPETLIKFKKTPNASYAGFGDTGQLLKKALCKEQGYICCYCMREISEQSMCVEHYIPQNRHKNSPYSKEIHKDNELKYRNMLASCNDKIYCCSERRGNEPLKVNPLDKNIEDLVSFANNGRISYKEWVKGDIDTVLKLNDKGLIDIRKKVLALVRKSLPQDSKAWSASVLKKELTKWSTLDNKGKYRPFCRIVIDYLDAKIKQLEK